MNYGSGNIWSIRSALSYLNCESEICHTPEQIMNSNALILPGVGSFPKAMESLVDSGMDLAIKEAVTKRGSKILGICLGMQLLANSSKENGYTKGLGLIDAEVDRFDIDNILPLKVPHIGFNRVTNSGQGTLFKYIKSSSDFYFVHSYRMLAQEQIGYSSICKYGEEFLAGYENNNIFAVQFHPEKSQTNGLTLLNNYIKF